MKILFINLPYYGHVVPTIGLVQELIQLSCHVTYLMPYDWEGKVTESGADFFGYKNHRQLAEQMKNAYAAADSIADQFDLILYEQFFFLGKHLADKHHKPAVRIFTAPVTNKKLMDEFISVRGPLSIFRCKWIARAFTRDIAGNIPLKTDNWLDEIVFNPPPLNLVYTLREYQPYESEFSDEEYKFLGPSVYERKSESFDFTKGENPVVYISLGTIVKGAGTFFRTCMETFRSEAVDVIISVGSKFDFRRMKNIPPNVHIYKSVPQVEVLKMADVFVTHGGMNSISEALTAAVPMVVIPFTSDQPTNARSMEKLGVGRKMDYTSADKNSLKSTIFSVLADQEIHSNLLKVQTLIQNAPGNKGGAEMILRFYQNQQ